MKAKYCLSTRLIYGHLCISREMYDISHPLKRVTWVWCVSYNNWQSKIEESFTSNSSSLLVVRCHHIHLRKHVCVRVSFDCMRFLNAPKMGMPSSIDTAACWCVVLPFRPWLLRLWDVWVRWRLVWRRLPVPGGVWPIQQEEQRALQKPTGGGLLQQR